MTIIVWDGYVLASDSRVTTESHLVTDSADKMVVFQEGIPYRGDTLIGIGMAGAVIDFDKVIDILQDEKFGTPASNFEYDVSGVVIGKKYVYEMEENSSYLIPYDRSQKLACGSGRPFALAAMHLGKNSVKAVEVAIALDCGCGGKVRLIKFTGE